VKEWIFRVGSETGSKLFTSQVGSGSWSKTRRKIRIRKKIVSDPQHCFKQLIFPTLGNTDCRPVLYSEHCLISLFVLCFRISTVSFECRIIFHFAKQQLLFDHYWYQFTVPDTCTVLVPVPVHCSQIILQLVPVPGNPAWFAFSGHGLMEVPIATCRGSQEIVPENTFLLCWPLMYPYPVVLKCVCFFSQNTNTLMASCVPVPVPVIDSVLAYRHRTRISVAFQAS
jgi:hypothetical protein